jgi:hypothetical protein
MPSPPQYERLSPSDLESQPLKSGFHDDEEHEDLPTYPPTGATGSGSGSGNGGDKPNVKYTFVPRYPVKGEVQHAIGVIGGSKEVSRLLIE